MCECDANANCHQLICANANSNSHYQPWLLRQTIPSSFLSCAREAVLLLLSATGWRVDDVWKLSNQMEVSDEAVTLFFAEKRKRKIKGKFTTSQADRRFQTNERVCPV
jgi:hypothetical protein